jgi:hypothetical protein
MSGVLKMSRVFRIALLVTGLAMTFQLAASALVSTEGRRAQAPEVAVGQDGSIHVIWLDKGTVGTQDQKGTHTNASGHTHQAFSDLMYARSIDGGQSFTKPVRVNQEAGQVWGFSVSKPTVAIGAAGVVHIMYPVNAISSKIGKSVASSYYVQSSDGGNSFSKPLQLNSDPDEDLSELVSGGLAQAQVFGAMSVSPAGDIYTFWLDTREMNATDMLSSVYLRLSHDNGATFEQERRLFPADTCPCCQVTSVVDESGGIYISSRIVSSEKIRTPTISVSRDGGKTFSERTGTGGTPWQLDGCPLKATAIAAQGEHVYTLVHNGAEEPPGLLFARSANGGMAFEPPSKIHPGALVSDSPSLAVTDVALFAAWHAKTEGLRKVFARISHDQGQSFGAVMQLPTIGSSVGYPEVAAFPDGSVAVVWQDDETIRFMRVEATADQPGTAP